MLDLKSLVSRAIGVTDTEVVEEVINLMTNFYNAPLVDQDPRMLKATAREAHYMLTENEEKLQ